jgi:hypothetical protein
VKPNARLFISYAHEDRDLCDELKAHLAGLEQDGTISGWYDCDILPGADWEKEIAEHLEKSDVVLLLVSAHFRASEYCGFEMKHALEKAERRQVVVVPVILRPVDWLDAPFAHLQALPSDGRPVVKWRSRDDAFLEIIRSIRRLVEESLPEKPQPVVPPIPSAAPQPRTLDAAMAPRIPMGKPADLAVMVRRTDSAGLKGVLEIDDAYSAKPEDVRSKPFCLEFPVDRAGKPKSAALTIKLESPEFEPPSQTKKLVVPPDGDSDVCTFLITPLFTGELIVNLEVYAGEGQQISRALRIVSEASDRVLVGGKMLVSIPLYTVAASELESTTTLVAAAAAAPPPVAAHAPLPPAQGPTFPADGATLSMPRPASGTPAASQSSPPPPAPAKSRLYAFAKPATIAAAAALLIGVVGPRFISSPTAPRESARNSEVDQVVVMAKRVADPPVAALAPAPVAASAEETWKADYAAGVKAWQGGNLQEAETALRRSTKIEPSKAETWYALGRVLQDANKLEEAEKALTKAVELDGTNQNARLLLASLQVRNKPAEAKKQVQVLINDKTLAGPRLDAAKRLSKALGK